jgi:hypothetical protein
LVFAHFVAMTRWGAISRLAKFYSYFSISQSIGNRPNR